MSPLDQFIANKCYMNVAKFLNTMNVKHSQYIKTFADIHKTHIRNIHTHTNTGMLCRKELYSAQ